MNVSLRLITACCRHYHGTPRSIIQFITDTFHPAHLSITLRLVKFSLILRIYLQKDRGRIQEYRNSSVANEIPYQAVLAHRDDLVYHAITTGVVFVSS